MIISMHGAVRGDERLGVAAEGVDVGEAAHGVEVVLLVVIEGLLVAQALPDGVRVGLVLLVERIPGQWLGVDSGHCGPPSTPTWCASQSLMPPRMPALVVHHGDALEHVAEVAPVDPATVAAADVEVVEEAQRIEVGDGLAHPLVPALVADLLAGRLADLLVEGLALAELEVGELHVRHAGCRP